ncbi:MAG: geranylgeranylglyceryl/heptaprenylglyceryl phosphate synthase [Bacteroidales bacterium]|nr:geranylgeranylglyceryl/heptaprenylglyceryl phosphate synthase [Bacteroidales bacterium]
MMKIYESITNDKKKKQFAVLIDPDNYTEDGLISLIKTAVDNKVDFFFIGGSLLMNQKNDDCIRLIKRNCRIPVILFPGDSFHISDNADAILFLSLISGRNPEMLIGKHVIAAPHLKNTSMDIIPTGYMLIDSGKPTTVQYMSNTCPIPAAKNDIAVCTAMAGEMLGMKLIYMDAGSGAENHVPESMIRKVKESISVPLIIGGGIDSPEKAKICCEAGADIVVVGNAIEKNTNLIPEISETIRNIE